ncbi:MAG: 3-isopropylmalate dehydratase small subunit [Pelagibacteraceae bacterium]|jgi:3-isopropylmalate/(R)-2-methylmalate dehydratase small subunit|nr:MAG: 3-isopropylmalate dehydratase small subunit [Pelagibacteraceae bacterium]|tara:strand:- start:519 stop:1127 length:609 start_codon:yes stop_codon:yes gene_type:complete
MDKFTTLQGIAAPLPIVNIDTDMIIPKQFLKTIKRTGLGVSLFYEMRYDTEGKLIEDFVLNTKPYDNSKILVAGDNFGCGSSREHAPWSLKDFGIRCVISTSFADIFYNNCFQNGILPIVVNAEELDRLMSAAGSQLEFNIDLPNQSIQVGNHSINFDIEDHRKERLLQGLDDIGITLGYKEDISSYESNKKTQKPWLFGDL